MEEIVCTKASKVPLKRRESKGETGSKRFGRYRDCINIRFMTISMGNLVIQSNSSTWSNLYTLSFFAVLLDFFVGEKLITFCGT
jgi:hypothetical protein